MSKPLGSILVLLHQSIPVSNHRISQKKYPMGYRANLGDTTGTLIGVALVTDCPWRYKCFIQIRCQDPAQPCTRLVSLHFHQFLLPFQQVIGLMYINEDLSHHFLENSRNLLENFCLRGGCPMLRFSRNPFNESWNSMAAAKLQSMMISITLYRTSIHTITPYPPSPPLVWVQPWPTFTLLPAPPYLSQASLFGQQSTTWSRHGIYHTLIPPDKASGVHPSSPMWLEEIECTLLSIFRVLVKFDVCSVKNWVRMWFPPNFFCISLNSIGHYRLSSVILI